MIRQDMKNPPHHLAQAIANAKAVPLGGWAAVGLWLSSNPPTPRRPVRDPILGYVTPSPQVRR